MASPPLATEGAGEPDARDIRGACPLDCPDTCSWIVTVKGTPTRTQRASGAPPEGDAVALRGDPHHPYTRGSLCNKVADYLNYARSPDRILDDAAPRRIASGDEVRVANARGSFLAVAEVSDRIRPGVVASTKGRWPRDSKEGATVNATVDERDSEMGGGAVYHDNRVRVDKTSAFGECERVYDCS